MRLFGNVIWQTLRDWTILMKHQCSLGWSQAGPVVICHHSPVGVIACLRFQLRLQALPLHCRLLVLPCKPCTCALIQRSLLKTLPPLLPLHSSMLLALSSHASRSLREFLGRKLMGRRLCANSVFLQPDPATERTGWFYCLHLVRRRISCD